MNRYLLLLTALLLFAAYKVGAQVNLSNGLVAYYPFNGTFNDASGNGNNGTAMNGVTFATDQWGNSSNAAFFDGIDDWINVGVPSFTFGRAFSIAFRFKTNSSVHQVLFSKSDYTGSPINCQFEIAFNHPGRTPKGLYLGTNHTGTCTYGPSGDMDNFGITTQLIQPNQWYCVVMTFNNGVKSIYLNGSLAYQATVTGVNNPTKIDSCTSSQFRIGSWWQNDPRYFSGLMDEARLYSRSLNQQEIDSICNLVVTPATDTIINRYAAITAISPCANLFTVDTATGFIAGDTVLIMQMKGATIDSSNTSGFGSILSYHGAGNYEYNVVQSVSGNNIKLKYKVQGSFDIPAGLVQLIKVPCFATYTTLRRHVCLPWNGKKGGVFAIRVAGNLMLNNSIDVSGCGFRGGIANNTFRSTQLCSVNDYYNAPNFDSSSQKGEGIANISLYKTYGRGRLANGGGGGNAHNSGGAGGANGGAGGQGGMQYSSCSSSASVNSVGGIGGIAPVYSAANSKVFLGGGGGAGHANNANTISSNGGNGGGIVIINAGSIGGNASIVADGNDAPQCPGSISGCADDGMGGGGAGGSLLIIANSLSGPTLAAAGGKGGDVFLSPSFINLYHGPGGGGGGGVVLGTSSIASSLTGATVIAGASGVMPQNSNSTYGAQAGAPGQINSGFNIPFPSTAFTGPGINPTFHDSTIQCFARRMINTSVNNGSTTPLYLWSFPGGVTSSLANPTFTFPGYGSFPVTLSVTDSSGCTTSITQNVIIRYRHFANGTGDTTLCNTTKTLLSAQGGVQYSWIPTSGLSAPNAATTIASLSGSTVYTVFVTDSLGCVDSDMVHVAVLFSSAILTATPADTTVCAGAAVQLYASGSGQLTWTPTAGLSDAHSFTPIATITGDIRYIVSATDTNGCTLVDTVNLHTYPLPEVSALAEGLGSKCERRSVLLTAFGNALNYHWTPSVYVVNSNSSSTEARPPVTTLFSVTGTDARGCSNTDTVTAFVHDEAVVTMPDAFSPNGDKRNDIIRPLIFCDFILTEYHIYDRWGNAVFSSNSITDGWNGSRGGTPADVGVYHYLIIGKRTSTNQEIIRKGSFMLMR